ncbi:IS3 family transposase [Paenibacillus sp. J22TS3]|uniref:IS3 family transposase n=1 Tax=Paenibacillus sp. J22TS3 TaxID=2807192 RepID=UPI002457BC03|nr:IS3 family transposase [Paenibacillus sp. J22TS3]
MNGPWLAYSNDWTAIFIQTPSSIPTRGTHHTHPRTRLLIAKARYYKDCQSLKELRLQVNDYMAYYNSEGYQWTLKKMTSDEFRSHLLAA